MAARHVVNTQGQMFRPEKPLESSVIEQIICLYNQGYSQRHITRVLWLSTYSGSFFSLRRRHPTKITDDVLQCLSYVRLWKIKKPNMKLDTLLNLIHIRMSFVLDNPSNNRVFKLILVWISNLGFHEWTFKWNNGFNIARVNSLMRSRCSRFR